MVTVYTKPGCVHCDRTKALMNNLGVEFEEIDVTTDAEFVRIIKEELGYQVVPVVIAGTDSWAGFQPERIKRLAED